MHHIAHCSILYWFAHFFSCMCVWFCRVDTDTEQYEQYEQEYEHTPQEDPACTATADLTGEPFLFTYFKVLLSLLLLSFGCDSFVSRVLFHLLPYTSRVSLPLPIALFVCLQALRVVVLLVLCVFISICYRDMLGFITCFTGYSANNFATTKTWGGLIINAEASVDDTFVNHLCPLGPEFLLSVLRLSALTTRGSFSGNPLT